MTNAAAKKLITFYFNRWSYRMGLKWWTLTLKLLEDPEELRRVLSTYKEDEVTLGETFSDWRYMTATLYFNVPALATRSESMIERVVIHELGHCLVNEARENEQHHEERVVATLVNAFKWTEEDVLKTKKK